MQTDHMTGPAEWWTQAQGVLAGYRQCASTNGRFVLFSLSTRGHCDTVNLQTTITRQLSPFLLLCYQKDNYMNNHTQVYC